MRYGDRRASAPPRSCGGAGDARAGACRPPAPTNALHDAARFVAIVAITALAIACASPPPPPPPAPKGSVVLLPEKDGQPTALAVKQGDREIVLDRPFAAAKVTSQSIDAYRSSQQEVDQEFGEALAAQPERAEKFVLYFVEGKDEFTDESKALVEKVLSEVARRPVPDVLVVGHTDAVGTDQANDVLGQRRADTVRVALIARGIPAADIRAISRGKRELFVQTPDGVAHPRNRRVEIIVR
jgi:outer membrane protein OmpA-like peptidoglycan-associated protein